MKLLVCFIAVFVASLNLVHADEHPGVSTELIIRSGNDWTGSLLPPYLSDAPEIAVMKYIIPPEQRYPFINILQLTLPM